MEFDARTKDPDTVGWECTVVLPPDEDSEEDAKRVTLKFRDFSFIPGRISIDNLGNEERQLWGSLSWGLIEPKNWPEDSKLSSLNLFRALPMDVVFKIHRAWQKAAGVSLGESSDSKDSSESTETS